jgi:hypothetical protein
MNSASTSSQVRRSVTAALAFAAVLLSAGCSTTTSAMKGDSVKSDAYAEHYGELHGIMAKLAAQSDQKTAALPAPATASISSGLASSAALASNP